MTTFKEETERVARRMAEELGINLHGTKICPSCGHVIENRNWCLRKNRR